ncbi:hypothetical protein BJL95_15410 [Methylomonas sp. LWB]|nr:hypothetical protein BJL95_15410 [Methylomonas sp. LWB]
MGMAVVRCGMATGPRKPGVKKGGLRGVHPAYVRSNQGFRLCLMSIRPVEAASGPAGPPGRASGASPEPRFRRADRFGALEYKPRFVLRPRVANGCRAMGGQAKQAQKKGGRRWVVALRLSSLDESVDVASGR